MPEALVERASFRCGFAPFHSPATALAAVDLHRVTLTQGDGVFALRNDFGVDGRFRIDGRRVEVDVEDEGYAAIAAIRLATHVGVVRAGGVLLHASAVAFTQRVPEEPPKGAPETSSELTVLATGPGGAATNTPELAVLATGPSGAGKSTLAKLLIGAGGRLLSDEIVALFPGGRVYGTPFRSNLESPGSAEAATLRLVVTLSHGQGEVLNPLPAASAMQMLTSQAFRPVGAELELVSVLQRMAAAVSGAQLREFTFRPVAAAADFLKERLLEAHAR